MSSLEECQVAVHEIFTHSATLCNNLPIRCNYSLTKGAGMQFQLLLSNFNLLVLLVLNQLAITRHRGKMCTLQPAGRNHMIALVASRLLWLPIVGGQQFGLSTNTPQLLIKPQ